MGGSGKWIKSLINLGKSQPYDHVSSVFCSVFFWWLYSTLLRLTSGTLMIFYRIKEVVREGNGSYGGVHQAGSL